MNTASPFTALFDQLKTTLPGGFFVTGTDTDIGKTYVSCQLANALQQNQPGLVISARKPIASGALRDHNDTLYSEDALQLQQATGNHETLVEICHYLFEEPISPARAIQQAINQGGERICIQNLVSACRVPTNHFALVEGAGGIYSPLAIDGLNIDLATALQLPVILVVGNKLGCLNHALLSISAIENAGLKLLHIFVNNLSDHADPNTLNDLQNLTVYPISQIPFQTL
ncbi:dethiobiotin synthase [Hydrogenovibrio sp. SC-1]|uniref:dethiobiotin synthase n=1 Tax=Hydrogenovibrio sp. SC-1 TaxID=2065820 RepID=UPI000C7A59C3|nr:dethiobiotin synthase [Hydrogenovibrio sp. SC-1]PLA74030.1 dethiobiotin synthase [Hydrogenovibrio sp. SC-1]